MRPVNLLPSAERRDRLEVLKTASTPALAFAGSTIALVAVLVAGFLFEHAQLSGKRRTLDSLQAELTATPPPRRPSDRGTQLVQDKNKRVVALNKALTGRVAWDRVFRDLSSVLPGDVWLSRVKATAPNASASTTTSSSSGSSSSAA